MPSMADTGNRQTIGALQILMAGVGPNDLPELTTVLEKQGYRVRRTRDASEAEALVRFESPSVIVVAGEASVPARAAGLRAAARSRGIPLIDVVGPNTDLQSLADRHGDADEVVFQNQLLAELPARIGRLTRRARREAKPARDAFPALDSRFFSLVVHDLRTPLNVIGLSLRMVNQTVPKGDPDLEEDLRFIDENFKQIERMLTQLSDYCRLFEAEPHFSISEFSPQRLVHEIIDGRLLKSGGHQPAVRLDVDPTCPDEASLDAQRARLAIQYALLNAIAAAGEATVSVAMRGSPDRWLTEIRVDKPAPSSVKTLVLGPNIFERLCGTAAERRGMDLAIVARISELFGGSARLDVLEGQGSVLTLDWPTQIRPAAR